MLDDLQCKRFKHLNHMIDDLLVKLLMCGEEMAPKTIRTLFLWMPPDSSRTETTRRPEVENLDLTSLTDWAAHQTIRERSEKLAEQADEQRADELASPP